LERVPILGEIDMTNVDIYLGPKMPIAFVFFSKDEDKERFEKELFPLAEKYRPRFIIALINGLEHGSHATTLGLQDNRFPAVVIHELVSGYKYPFSQDESVSSSTLGPYFESFANGSLQPYFISAPIPEKNDGPVKILVHDNFKSIALDPTKDVLVELYTACKTKTR
jgi:protein disulfide-isomerase A1